MVSCERWIREHHFKFGERRGIEFQEVSRLKVHASAQRCLEIRQRDPVNVTRGGART